MIKFNDERKKQTKQCYWCTSTTKSTRQAAAKPWWCVFNLQWFESNHHPRDFWPPQGSYSLPKTDFDVPHVDMPAWMTNGNYRVQGMLGADGKELGCLKLAVSLRSNWPRSIKHTGSWIQMHGCTHAHRWASFHWWFQVFNVWKNIFTHAIILSLLKSIFKKHILLCFVYFFHLFFFLKKTKHLFICWVWFITSGWSTSQIKSGTRNMQHSFSYSFHYFTNVFAVFFLYFFHLVFL